MIRNVIIIGSFACTAPATAGPARPLKPYTTIGKIENLRSYRWIDAKDEATGLRLSGFKLRYGRGGIRIDGDAHDIEIRNGSLITKGINSGNDLPAGIDLRGTVHGVVIENVISQNNQMVVVPDKYVNGDGFSQEHGVYNVTYRGDTALDNSDGGFDLKGEAKLDETVATRNGRNYRFWGNIVAGKITSIDPTNAHVWLNAKASQKIVIDNLIAQSRTTAPVLRIENSFPVAIVIKRCTLRLPPGTKMIWGGNNAKVTLGPGCSV